MGVYDLVNGNKIPIATNISVINHDVPVENYVTEGELVAGLAEKQDVMQYSELPTPSGEYLDKIYQYVGETDGNYTNGYWYKCVYNNNVYSWQDVGKYSADSIRIIVNKGKNVLINANYHTIYSNNTNIYYTTLTALNPNTTYKMWIQSNTDISITSWNSEWIKSGDIVSVPSTGAWVTFTTKNVSFNNAQYEELFRLSNNSEKTLNNVCAVKLSDWNSELTPIEDNSGYVYVLPFSMNKDFDVEDSFCFENDIWYKVSKSHNIEVSKQQLDMRSSCILNCVTYIVNNHFNNYDVTVVNQNGDFIYDINSIQKQDIEYIHTSDYRFIHKNNEFKINAMTIGTIRIMQETGDETTYKLRPAIYLDSVNVGSNVIQYKLALNNFYNGEEGEGSAKNPSEYQYIFDSIDIATQLGLRVIFKGYFVKNMGDATQIAKAMRINKMFIDRYKDNKFVIGYSVFNEPINALPNYTWTQQYIETYSAFMKEIQYYIRQNAPNQIMFFEDNKGECVDLTAPNIAYEYHYYSPHAFAFNAGHLADYPADNYLYSEGSLIASSTSADSTSSYDTDINFNGTTGTITKQICRGRYYLNRFGNDGDVYAKLNCSLRINSSKINNLVDIRGWAINFYDQNGNLTHSWTKTFTSDDDLSEYRLTKGGQQVTLSDYMSIVNDNDTYVLRFINIDSGTTGYQFLPLNPDLHTSSLIKSFDPTTDVYGEVVFDISASSNDGDVYTFMRIDSVVNIMRFPFAMQVTDNFNKVCLRYHIQDAINQGFNMPLYIGEVGVENLKYPSARIYWKDPSSSGVNHGGELWAENIVNQLHEQGISFSWFGYEGATFGLYNAWTYWRNISGEAWGKPLYNKLVGCNSNFIPYIPIEFASKVAKYDKRPVTSNAVVEKLATKADKSESILISNSIPTASENYLGQARLYIGDTSANYTYGCIYECVSDGASTPTYSWSLVGISTEVLKTITAASSDFADYQSRIAAL